MVISRSASEEIRFFRIQCWGNPPADYRERQQRQQDELKEMEKKYTVVDGVQPFGPLSLALRQDMSLHFSLQAVAAFIGCTILVSEQLFYHLAHF